jgi:hypothetical protein
VAANVTEGLSVVNEQSKDGMERFISPKLENAKVTDLYQVKMSKRTAAFGNSDDSVDVSRTWEDISKNIRM